MKKLLIGFLFAISIGLSAQTYDYNKTFEWVVTTFSQNDAGFQYIIDKKGEREYNFCTEKIKIEVSKINTDEEFINLVLEWLNFFRKGHVEFGLKNHPNIKNHAKSNNFDDENLHLDILSDNTVYLRIPSFAYQNKSAIDSIINIHTDLIANTPNLIIDIRNGMGGSDASFYKLLPLLYTNPIRTPSIEFKATELNAQGFDYYAKETNNPQLNNIAKLFRQNIGQFISLGSDKTSVFKLDTIMRNPSRIGIIINEQNVSSDEQFLLTAKQSWKVKLFGRTTKGAIDISNMTFTFSPDEKFYLSYCMSKSKRIPDFIVDDIGLQPDFFIDSNIPETEWIDYTKRILEN